MNHREPQTPPMARTLPKRADGMLPAPVSCGPLFHAGACPYQLLWSYARNPPGRQLKKSCFACCTHVSTGRYGRFRRGRGNEEASALLCSRLLVHPGFFFGDLPDDLAVGVFVPALPPPAGLASGGGFFPAAGFAAPAGVPLFPGEGTTALPATRPDVSYVPSTLRRTRACSSFCFRNCASSFCVLRSRTWQSFSRATSCVAPVRCLIASFS
mmetsp:Transcript_11980/g.29011  ORF Transcript_11980/g.29011 Transcript_11980/m.29011 type:complete len:212 (+) Transcript_11980:329-964(+)